MNKRLLLNTAVAILALSSSIRAKAQSPAVTLIKDVNPGTATAFGFATTGGNPSLTDNAANTAAHVAVCDLSFTADGKLLIATGAGKVYTLANGSATFAEPNTAANLVTSIDGGSNANSFMGTGVGGKITTNGGASYTVLNGSPVDIAAINGLNHFVAGLNGLVYYYVSGNPPGAGYWPKLYSLKRIDFINAGGANGTVTGVTPNGTVGFSKNTTQTNANDGGLTLISPSGFAEDIAIGSLPAPDQGQGLNMIYITDAGGNVKLYWGNGNVSNSWLNLPHPPSNATRITVDPSGRPWIAMADGNIAAWTGGPSSASGTWKVLHVRTPAEATNFVNYFNLPAGGFNITENPVAGYTLQSILHEGSGTSSVNLPNRADALTLVNGNHAFETFTTQQTQVSISGTVYDDNDGITGGVNGMPKAGVGVTLYAANGTSVLATATTDAAGNYSFPNQVAGNYIAAITLPAGYQHVSGTDATPGDGRTSITAGTGPIPGINFGINQPAVTTNDNLAGQPPGAAATIANLLSNDSDPNNGILSPDSISLIPPAGATGIVVDSQSDTTGFTVPGQGTWSLNSATGALSFAPIAGFINNPAPVSYTVTDKAGLRSNMATVTIGFNPLVTISGIVYVDNDGITGGVNGTPKAGVGLTLYAANGTVMLATATTDANGHYSFPGQVAGNYITAITLPAGYRNVSATDATPGDGRTGIIAGSTPVQGIDFGIGRPPVAVNDSQSNITLFSSATIANLLSNDSDPNGGTLSPDSISLAAPAGATGIAIDSQGDTTGFTVPGQGAWSLDNTTGALSYIPLSGDFVDDPTPVGYTVTDNAGLTSNIATVILDYHNPTVSGRVYDDNDGLTNRADGTPMAGVMLTLYAGKGITVLATTITDTGGRYSFIQRPLGRFYIDVTPPAGYRAVSNSSGYRSNSIELYRAGFINTDGTDFGLNRPPVAVNDYLYDQDQGSPATIANLLSNDSDPNNGTLLPGNISLITPSGATNINANGFTVPGQGSWLLNPTTGSLTFTPQPGFFSDPTAIVYTITDAANLRASAQAAIYFSEPEGPIGRAAGTENSTSAAPVVTDNHRQTFYNAGKKGTGDLLQVSESGLVLYPNPAKDVLFIDTKAGKGIQRITVYNATGQQMYDAAVTTKAKYSLSIAEYTPGIYMLKIKTHEGYLTRRFEVLR